MKKQIIISIEGNIGAGKTTFLELLKKKLIDFQTLEEPLNNWLNTKDSTGENILQQFYADKQKNSFMFQCYALLTRIKQFNEINPKSKIVFVERSVNSDMKIFVKCLYQDKDISEMQWIILNKQFDFYTQNIPADNQKIINIYLQCSPQICYNRIMRRNRVEELEIPLQYIQKLHDLHENWLLNEKNVIIIDASLNFKDDQKIFDNIVQTVVTPLI